MNNPREILNRAVRARRNHAPAAPARPAPAPQPAVPAPQPPAKPPVEGRAEPRSGGHALYRELMRSHDRMGTRHLNRPE